MPRHNIATGKKSRVANAHSASILSIRRVFVHVRNYAAR